MKTLLTSAAFAAAVLAPSAAVAQALPPAIVAVVDLDSVTRNCNACKTAQAALQARIKSFQTKYQQAQDEAQRGRAQLQANQTYIQKQIEEKLNPIYQQVMQRRGANLLVEVGSTLATSRTVDVTGDVLAALNAALPSLVTTAPAQPQPQGR